MSKKNDIPVPPTVGEKKKKAESKYDANVLRKLIKEGKTAKEIMETMNIAHKQILKHHVLKLCSSDHCFYEIPGLYGNAARKAYVNSKGEIKIKQNMIDFGSIELIPEKTEFDVTVEGNKIILTLQCNGDTGQSGIPLEDHDNTMDKTIESQ